MWFSKIELNNIKPNLVEKYGKVKKKKTSLNLGKQKHSNTKTIIDNDLTEFIF